ADPRVRVRVAGRWHHGTAHLLPDDDAVARLVSRVSKIRGQGPSTLRPAEGRFPVADR
ncbi:nitroreductase/quinone reductase family protein, partial [Streptomyces sp. SAS_269]|uniref:nitroreductase/quinone reductase family protein n=1 Tax=Streptomyces sp. SAS_269 TaxID=3412749 RepID=UPI00403D46A1